MTDLTVTNSALPAHLQTLFGGAEVNDDMTAGVSGGYPIISYRGKVWAISRGGERTIIVNEEGDPRASIEVVLIKANPNVSKIYYPAGYEEGSNDKPTCYSNDGITPGLDAEERQAEKCAVCPHNQWGSRISETGAKGKACSDSRRVAVASPQDLEDVMLLRIPAASLRELADYGKGLSKRGVPYQALTTKVRFDPESAYPKMLFQPSRWLTQEEAEVAAELRDSTLVGDITTLTMSRAAGDVAAVAAQPEADPLAALGPRPDFVPPTTATAAPAPAPAATTTASTPRRGRPPKAAVTQEQVNAALGGQPAPATSTGLGATEAPAPVQAAPVAEPAPQTNTLVAAAEQSLDELLGSLGLDD
jgi:hypothetical protein